MVYLYNGRLFGNKKNKVLIYPTRQLYLEHM